MPAQQLSKITVSSIANHFCQKRSQAPIYNHQEDYAQPRTRVQNYHNLESSARHDNQPQTSANICILILLQLSQGSALRCVDLKPHTYDKSLMLVFTFYPACSLPQSVHDNADKAKVRIYVLVRARYEKEFDNLLHYLLLVFAQG